MKARLEKIGGKKWKGRCFEPEVGARFVMLGATITTPVVAVITAEWFSPVRESGWVFSTRSGSQYKLVRVSEAV